MFQKQKHGTSRYIGIPLWKKRKREDPKKKEKLSRFSFLRPAEIRELEAISSKQFVSLKRLGAALESFGEVLKKS